MAEPNVTVGSNEGNATFDMWNAEFDALVAVLMAEGLPPFEASSQASELVDELMAYAAGWDWWASVHGYQQSMQNASVKAAFAGSFDGNILDSSAITP